MRLIAVFETLRGICFWEFLLVLKDCLARNATSARQLDGSHGGGHSVAGGLPEYSPQASAWSQ